jgi:hypothetical protein
LEDAVVKEALKSGVDLREYSAQVSAQFWRRSSWPSTLAALVMSSLKVVGQLERHQTKMDDNNGQHFFSPKIVISYHSCKWKNVLELCKLNVFSEYK